MRVNLREAAHRPYPPPRAPWVMRMVWVDLLFMHWPVPAAALRPLIPADLAVDTFTGGGFTDQAFIGVVPFLMTGVCGRMCPPVPTARTFPELNVRTYVLGPDGRPGVWFFSLDAASAVAVRAARTAYRLPYRHARMSITREGGSVRYESRRTDRRDPGAEFAAAYGAAGPVYRSSPGTLDHFLTERYCLYAPGRRRRSLRAEIHHAPWPLQPGRADVARNTMAAPLGIDLGEGPHGAPPLLHFAARLEVVAWAPWPVHAGSAAR